MKSYSECLKFKTLSERYDYLRITQAVGDVVFGGSRYLNQRLYLSPEWKSLRSEIILRDSGNDLAVDGYEIRGKILIHHINPITKDDLINRARKIFDPENLICCSFDTHQAIHYGNENLLPPVLVERRPFDTVPWR